METIPLQQLFILHLLLQIRIHDIKHANHPVKHGEGGSNDGTDKVRHSCRSSKLSLSFDALLLRFAGIWMIALLLAPSFGDPYSVFVKYYSITCTYPCELVAHTFIFSLIQKLKARLGKIIGWIPLVEPL